MQNHEKIKTVRDGLRRFNRRAGVLKSDPYGIGLSLSQSSALVDIDRFGNLSSSQLVQLLNLEKSSVSRLVAVLVEKKYIEVKSDSLDARIKNLILTKEGKKAVKTINDVSNETVEDVFKLLSPHDRENVARVFQKISLAVEMIEK